LPEKADMMKQTMGVSKDYYLEIMDDLKLEKAYKSMVSGGLLVIQDFLLNNDKTGPLKEALFNVMVGAFSEEELLNEIGDAGFVEAKVVVQAEEFGSSWVTAVKP